MDAQACVVRCCVCLRRIQIILFYMNDEINNNLDIMIIIVIIIIIITIFDSPSHLPSEAVRSFPSPGVHHRLLGSRCS
jgi:hypothetical protein